MSENLIASLQVGSSSPSMPVEEYRARKVALVTGKLYLFCPSKEF